MVLSSWPKSLREFTRFIWWMQTERRVAANTQTKPIDLGCESAKNCQLPSTSTIAIVDITQPLSWYSFYQTTEGGRLSRSKHCSKGAQPVLNTVYRSSCRDKHNCQRRDSNLGPLTPQSDHSATETCTMYRVPLPDSDSSVRWLWVDVILDMFLCYLHARAYETWSVTQRWEVFRLQHFLPMEHCIQLYKQGLQLWRYNSIPAVLRVSLDVWWIVLIRERTPSSRHCHQQHCLLLAKSCPAENNEV